MQLFWGIEGTGEFIIDTVSYMLSPGQVFFYLPGDKHIISTHSKKWNYRWLTIDGTFTSEVVQGFNFPKSPSKAGSCPEELFLKLEREILDNTPKGQCMASATVYSILTLVSSGSKLLRKIPSISEKCIEIIKKNFSDPFFGVNQLADMLGKNRSRLSRLFREEMGTTLKNYIVSCRIQKGLSLIKETRMPIAKIAKKCGYSNANYFAKAIKKASELSPREFREVEY